MGGWWWWGRGDKKIVSGFSYRMKYVDIKDDECGRSRYEKEGISLARQEYFILKDDMKDDKSRWSQA